MGLIREEIKHKFLDAEIQVVERTSGEMCEPYEIISLDIDSMDTYSPNDLINLGNWLIEQATMIKKTYTSTGKLKKNGPGNRK